MVKAAVKCHEINQNASFSESNPSFESSFKGEFKIIDTNGKYRTVKKKPILQNSI